MSDNVRDWLSAGIFGAPKRKKEEETKLKYTRRAMKSAPRKAHALATIGLCLLALHFCFELRKRFLFGGKLIFGVAILAELAEMYALFDRLPASRAFFFWDKVDFRRRNSIDDPTDNLCHSPTFLLLGSGPRHIG